ncbi:MAG: 50S ribosomal protein L5 [Candidatus Saganbacteria bacterium]|nr:50S ribosomal protein L5 [Candidatus Saganbacteria bacterium]
MLPLKERYRKEIMKEMTKKFGYKNSMEVPRLVKVVVSRGVGEITQNPKAMDIAAEELSVICGQKPLITKSKKAIAGFKLRGNLPIGCFVTLRGDRMYEFLDKFINICLPKIRDFKGVNPKSFDGRGNYSLGIKEQLVFPEIIYDKVDKTRGMNITVVTSAKNDDQARELLALMGIPFRKN